MRIRSIALSLLGVALAMASPASAEDADYYRGGWRTEAGDPHVYEFVIRGDKVTGIYCSHCADGTTLAPLEGTFDERDGIAFTIRHLNLDGSLAATDRLHAKLQGGRLVVSGTDGSGHAVEHVAIKDPRGPAPSPFPINIMPPNAPPVPILPRPPEHAR